MKQLEITNTTLVDILMVTKTLAEDEVKQIEAFSGQAVSADQLTISLMNSAAMMWTARLIEGGEPLVVGGYVQTGPTIFRSFFLANPRVWAEHGSEITDLTRDTIEKILENSEYARLETYCLLEREDAQKWYEKIGLSKDGVLHGFGVKGEDAVLYSTVKKPSTILRAVGNMGVN